MVNFEDGNQDAENPETEEQDGEQFTRRLPSLDVLKDKLKPVNLPTYRLVSHVMLDCWDEVEPLLGAAWPEDAVEGSLDADDFTAAVMIRNYARKNSDKFPIVADMTVARVKSGMKRAMSEMDNARHQRRVRA